MQNQQRTTPEESTPWQTVSVVTGKSDPHPEVSVAVSVTCFVTLSELLHFSEPLVS